MLRQKATQLARESYVAVSKMNDLVAALTAYRLNISAIRANFDKLSDREYMRTFGPQIVNVIPPPAKIVIPTITRVRGQATRAPKKIPSPPAAPNKIIPLKKPPTKKIIPPVYVDVTEPDKTEVDDNIVDEEELNDATLNEAYDMNKAMDEDLDEGLELEEDDEEDLKRGLQQVVDAETAAFLPGTEKK